ncbi:uncharacterized protein LOC126382018 [Pectinophora gossypiella]|uniref:WH1 domain-containing protein n=2 Tax=Pectinophora gossypiella TaxID=13191 RepID=A0A1E1W035_PECGO|nr:uncharacterized protein LOC126382018 [Pectinophora gossypiella]
MLETDEVDDDYFTPVSTTTLASIFGSDKESKDEREGKKTTNESLKYTPPKQHVPQNVTEEKVEEESKLTECIFACALSAHEWTNNNYVNRGKVGFAIIKITKNNSHTIILYNSNKTTLSSTTVTSNLNMTVKGDNYICFYDSLSKYWSIYAKEVEVKKISEILTKFGVNIKYAVNTDHNPPDPNKTVVDKCDTATYNSGKESDTDSSVNRRTKASILNRMATMGHSVLPLHTLPADKSSDSSDNENTNQPPKITRPKPVKTINKRMVSDKNVAEVLDLSNSSKTTVAKIEQPLPTTSMVYTCINGQLVPVSNTNLGAAYGNNSNSEMNLFMSEQRINNNELRININRTADKVDQILEKIKGLEQPSKDKSISNFQTDIMQKLLSEYENKIKIYEQLLTSQNKNKIDEHLLKTSSNTSDEIASYKNVISELQNIVIEKDKEIKMLTDRLQENNLVKEITNLKQSLAIKNDQVEKLIQQLERRDTKLKTDEDDFENKLKYTMNDVYRSISVNFESNETYTGETVKNVTASVIKDVTIKFLNEYSYEK